MRDQADILGKGLPISAEFMASKKKSIIRTAEKGLDWFWYLVLANLPLWRGLRKNRI
jgi:hypothetical protein